MSSDTPDADSYSEGTDYEQFREEIEETLGEPVDEETAAEIKERFDERLTQSTQKALEVAEQVAKLDRQGREVSKIKRLIETETRGWSFPPLKEEWSAVDDTPETTAEIEEFREQLVTISSAAVDVEAAAAIATQYPDYIVAGPSLVTGELLDELTLLAELYAVDEVERVTRRTNELGELARLHIVLGGEEPNTGGIQEQIRSTNLFFTGAGIHDDRLHLHFKHIEMEVA